MRKFYLIVFGLLPFFAAQSQAQRSYTISNWGSFQWTAPCDVTEITVEAWGAGGNASSSSAGGGGAYSKRKITVTPGATYTIQVGRGGQSNNTRNSGFYLSGSALVMAEGALGGTGGSAAISIGDVKFSGGNGGNRTSRGGGGGGSSASSTQPGLDGGNSSSNTGADGGDAVAPDGGKGGNGGDGTNSIFGRGDNGESGHKPGGGGGQGGEGTGFLGSNGSHGSGADGQVRISYEGMAPYCAVGIGNTVEPITSVQFGNLINTTSNAINGTPGYESFCLTADVVKGKSYALTVKGNTNGRSFPIIGSYYVSYFTAFIDWNQDGDFDDAGESINIGTISNSSGIDGGSASVNISIPAGALTGKTKMRIIKNRSSYASSCQSPQNGQIEDYIINVQDQNATISEFTPTSGCVGANVTINGTNFTSATSVKFNGVNAVFTIVSATQITATVPVGAATGKISVTTPSNTATSSGNFTVNATTEVANVAGGGVHCESATLTATGTGTIYFQGMNENGTSTASGGATVSVNASGTYYFRSYNGSCWSPAKSVEVTIDQTPAVVTVTGASPSCGPTVITASGGSGYQIYFQGTTPNGTSDADPATSKTVSSSGTYYFRAKSACGWGPQGSITVTVNPVPAAVSVSATQTEFCSSTGTVLNATGGSGGTIYFQGTISGGASTAQQLSSVAVNEGGTYYFRSRSAAGCWGPEGSVTVVEEAGFSITGQPQNQSVCVGSNVTFNVAVNPSAGVSYQWYKEGVEISGATSSSYTINNAQLSNASYDYYALVTDACGNATTNHVSLAVNNPVTAPAGQPTNIQFITGATSIAGTFITTTADGYLVVRTTTASAPSAPVDGTIYTTGQNALGGYIEYSGPENIFSSTGLTQGTTYYYWIYAYNVGNGGCGSLVDYLNVNPLTGNATTATTTSCPGGIRTLYWAGEGSTVSNARSSTDFNDSRNWSLNGSSYQQSPSAPTECTDVVVKLRTESINIWPLGSISNNPNLELVNDIKVHNLELTSEVGGTSFWGVWTYNYNSNVSLNLNGKKLEVYGDANIGINRNENSVKIGDLNGANGGTIDFKADVTLGNNNFNDGEANFIGGATTKAIFRGSLTFGKLGGIDGSNPIDATFDGPVTSLVTWNNTANIARFRNVIIGVSNSPQVRFAGSRVPDNILGNLTLNNGSSLELLQGKQWNRHSNGGTLTLNQTSRLVLVGNSSIQNGGSATVITGSNFPSGFSTRNLSSASRVWYNGGSGDANEQTIYSGVNYGNVELSNGNTSGIALKRNTGTITFAGTFNINKSASWTLGAGVANNGTFNVNDLGILTTNSNVVSGSGTFTLKSGGTLGIGSTQGITSSGATGNVRSTGTRTFSNDANYVYNGSAHQVTGNGLPAMQRSLEINNGANVELTNDAEPVQLLKLTSGNLEIKNHTLTLNSVSYGANKLVGSDVSNITVKGTGVGLNLKPAFKDNTLKELELRENATAYISSASGDTLNITGGYDAPGQAGNIKLRANSQLTTNGNLTLKSNKLGTASLAEVEGTGTSIGKVVGTATVERYINSGTDEGEHGKKWLFLATPTGYNGTGQSIRQSWMEGGDLNSTGYGIHLTDPNGTASGWDAQSPAPAIKSYDPATNRWVSAGSANNPVYNANGWMVFVRGDRIANTIDAVATPTNLRSKGDLVIGNKSFNVPSDLTESKFYSIGNPYASAVDMRKVLTKEQDFHIWDPYITGEYSLGAYVVYGFDGQDYVTTPDPTFEPRNHVLNGQAFFVQQLPDPQVITFTENSKMSTDDNVSVFRTTVGSTIRPAMLRSNIFSGSQLVDGTLHMFNSDFSNDVNHADARKMFNTGLNLAIKAGGKSLIIERKQPVSVKDTIFYSMTGASNGSYRFMFNARDMSAPGLEAWLEDAFTKKQSPVNLEGVTEIPFEVTSAAASKAADRFRVVFKRAGALPVTFVKVNAVKDGRNVQVQWTVAQEQNVKEYVVMSSADGSSFTDMATVTASGATEYHATDTKPAEGYNYYRVRSVDIDGAKAYSEIARAYIGDAQPNLRVFPNPITDGNVYLRLENYPAGKYQVRLMNPGGQVMLTRSFDHSGGNYTERIPWDYKMAHGNYHLEVRHPDGSVKVIVVMY